MSLAVARTEFRTRPAVLRTSIALAASLIICLSAQGLQAGPPQAGQAAKAGAPITDVAAWQMLFLLVSDCPGCMDRSSRAGYLAPSGLTPKQIDVVIDFANVHRAFSNSVVRRAESIKKSNPRPYSKDVIRRFQEPFDELYPNVETQKAALEAELGVQDFQKLNDFVQTVVKAGIAATE